MDRHRPIFAHYLGNLIMLSLLRFMIGLMITTVCTMSVAPIVEAFYTVGVLFLDALTAMG